LYFIIHDLKFLNCTFRWRNLWFWHDASISGLDYDCPEMWRKKTVSILL